MAGAIMDKIWGVIGMNNNNQSEAEDIEDEDYDVDTYDNNYEDEEHINIGTGEEISIMDLAHVIKDIVGYTGTLYFDNTKPDGSLRKLLDSKKIHELGWKHKTNLLEGITASYKWFLEKY